MSTKDSTDKPLPLSKCTVCGYEMDAATEASSNGARPSPIDVAAQIRRTQRMIRKERVLD